jgi:hypothetical protein
MKTLEQFMAQILNESGKAPAVVSKGGRLDLVELDVLDFGQAKGRLMAQLLELNTEQFEAGRTVSLEYVCIQSGEPLPISVDTKEYSDHWNARDSLASIADPCLLLNLEATITFKHEADPMEWQALNGQMQ